MLTFVFCIIAAAGALSVLCYLTAAGFRNGDRPGDALVTALLVTGDHPEETRSLIVATVRNPSGTPVLTALRARGALLPAWLAGPKGISVPHWTTRRQFQPGEFGCVSVVPPGGAGEFAVPVPVRARHYLLTAAVGQEGGRLRVHRCRLATARGHGRPQSMMKAHLP